MDTRTITITIIITSIVVWIGWDIYVAFFNNEKGDTISAVVSDFAFRSVWHLAGVLLFIGALLGHWFWKLKDTSIRRKDGRE